MTSRWIKLPEGDWAEYLGTDDEWEWLRGTGHTPTAEGENPQDDEARNG